MPPIKTVTSKSPPPMGLEGTPMVDNLSQREAFIKKAVPYHVLAFAVFFDDKDHSIAYTKAEIELRLLSAVFSRDAVIPGAFERAVEICCNVGLIQQHTDAFGPTAYSAHKNFREAYKVLSVTYNGIFANYQRMDNGHSWLRNAIRQITSEWGQLPSSAAHEEQSDVWQPIPIERDEPNCEAAIKALDKVVEAVRADNGYSAEHGLKSDAHGKSNT